MASSLASQIMPWSNIFPTSRLCDWFWRLGMEGTPHLFPQSRQGKKGSHGGRGVPHLHPTSSPGRPVSHHLLLEVSLQANVGNVLGGILLSKSRITSPG